MNRLLVVVFSEPSQAFAGRDAMKGLDRDDSIALHAYAIITRNADGSIINEEDHHAGFNPLLGTSLKSLIDQLGNPKVVAIGAAGADPDEASVVTDFASEVSQQLTPGKFGLVAEIDEQWTPWVNLRMAELGGVVYRCPLFEAKDVAESADIAAMKANLAEMKAEHAQARAERQASLLEKIHHLEARIQQELKLKKVKKSA